MILNYNQVTAFQFRDKENQTKFSEIKSVKKVFNNKIYMSLYLKVIYIFLLNL